MGIFSKKFDIDEHSRTTRLFDELRKLIELNGTKVAILESRIEGISANVASIRNRINRSFRIGDESETSTIEDEVQQEGVKTETINNTVLLPEDGIVRKNSKRR